MKLKGEFVLREIAGDTVLVPVDQTALEFNGMITMNPAGGFVWKAVTEGKDRGEILQMMLDKYEVDEAVAAADLDEFINNLRLANLIE